jgi:NADH-quinone oxidoreductase subunit N
LFSLAGTPPLGGWVAKFVVFRSLLDAGGGWAVGLAVIGVVNSVIALFYYAAVSKEMWMNPAPDGDVRPIRIPAPLLVAVSGAAVLIVLIGIFPSIVLHFTDLTSLVALGS